MSLRFAQTSYLVLAIGSDKFDIDARAATTGLTRNQYRSMLQTLLADRFQLTVHRETTPDTKPDSAEPSLFTALHQQLGLRLESQKAPSEVLVIDHFERPREN